jgi:hypothetical protein
MIFFQPPTNHLKTASCASRFNIKAENYVVELSVSTRTGESGNALVKHLLPQNVYGTSTAAGTGYGFGAQWVAPTLAGEKFSLSGNAWVGYYPNIGQDPDRVEPYNMFYTQINVEPDVKKDKDDGTLSFVAKSVVPDNIKTKIVDAKGKIKISEIVLSWLQGAVKGRLSDQGTAGKVVSAMVPTAVHGSVELDKGKVKVKNVGVEYTKGF